MTAVSKNVYFDVLNYIVDKCNNTYHNTIKMKPIDVKNDSFAEYNEESNEKDYGANSYLFVNGAEIHKFKAKDSEVVATPLYLGNMSKDFSVDNMKKTGLNGYVYDFSVDYDAIAVDDILDIHKYLTKKNDIV